MGGFKNFIMRGNLVQLAVAVVIGAQFSGLVKQFVSSFIDPLLALAGGTPNFATLSFRVHKATFTYGAFLTDVLSFLIAALVVYFVLVLPVTRLIAFVERNKAATEKDCPQCTMSIPINAQRCPECTSMLVDDSGQSQPSGQSKGVLAPPS
jgi:large conductance mechanosensitive channel